MVPRAERPPHSSLPRWTTPKQQQDSRTSSPYSYQTEQGDADDERSASRSNSSRRYSSDDNSTMGPLSHHGRRSTRDDDSTSDDEREPAYPDEDTSPTSRRELLGFYAYSWAAEVFVICGLGAFIPITLEDLARASPGAMLAHDRSKPCSAEKTLASGGKHAGQQCVVRLPGTTTEVNTASFAMYTFSISVLLQALVVVTMSGAADHGRYRKTLLIAFAVIGSLATMGFLFVTPRVFWLGALWAVVGNVGFGASFVLLNSFLPLLVRWHLKGGRGGNREEEGNGDGVEEGEVSQAFLCSVSSAAEDVFFDSLLRYILNSDPFRMPSLGLRCLRAHAGSRR